ncbi:lipase family protein [Cytophaga aurantiaca]|uniref:lipase family protein n=1 Tax=Cytophaga aurantiaca TaxID=29530 RepID=UPI000381ECD9|nr:lipase family protein [Cytophaga aurantiaca]
MRTSIFILFLASTFLVSNNIKAQELKPGFSKEEYIETLKINYKAHIAVNKWMDHTGVSDPQDFNFVYRSPLVAFDNIWDLWKHKSKSIALIAVQGSVQTDASFLANLYAAMIPAKGTLQLDKDFSFTYNLADNPNAAVHVGWFVAMAYMSKTIVPKIDSCYKAGVKDFILTGHSQGGGITFLLNSYLENLKKQGKLPADIRFKTYCSAGPKPGNLAYAYEYENMTAGGWAYNVVNTADWVPDVPFSVQTVNDFTAVNPFRGAKKAIKRMGFPQNIALKHIYNKMSKPSLRAQKNYQKYLGKMVSHAVENQIPNFITPEYYNSNYYVRTGNTIILFPDEAYYNVYSNDSTNPNIWTHHFPEPYMMLAEKLK